MTVNPGAVVLLVVGAVALLIGVRGTQSAAFAALTGHSAKGNAPTSSAGAPVQPAAATGTTQSYLTNAQV